MDSRNFEALKNSIRNSTKPHLQERKETIENYIIDINNKLHDLCNFLQLDLEINQIHPDPEVRRKRKEAGFGDDEKRAIVASIIADERKEKERIKKEAMKAAGIDDEEFNKISEDKTIQRIATGSTIQHSYNIFNDVRDEMRDRIKSRVIKSGHGLAPPKTDWSRVDVSKDEKEKILESLRANPESKIFSKNFPWEPKEFLEAFKYLEESKEYNGPFIVSVIDSKDELQKYSNLNELRDKVDKVFEGKYVLISVYDITAIEKAQPEEAKYFYIGLNYKGMSGSLEFDTIGAMKNQVSKHQKRLAIEFMDIMKIEYDTKHIKLN